MLSPSSGNPDGPPLKQKRVPISSSREREGEEVPLTCKWDDEDEASAVCQLLDLG